MTKRNRRVPLGQVLVSEILRRLVFRTRNGVVCRSIICIHLSQVSGLLSLCTVSANALPFFYRRRALQNSRLTDAGDANANPSQLHLVKHTLRLKVKQSLTKYFRGLENEGDVNNKLLSAFITVDRASQQVTGRVVLAATEERLG